jgi:hypothetical protein
MKETCESKDATVLGAEGGGPAAPMTSYLEQLESLEGKEAGRADGRLL